MKNNNLVEKFWSENHLGKGVIDTKNIHNFFLEHSNLSDKQTTFKKYLPKEKNKDILDIACGVGYWLDKYNDYCEPHTLTGIDISDSSIKICKARFKNSNILLINSNAEDLKLLDGKFDFISCHGALHHMQNPDLALLEMTKLLKEGGEMNISIYYKNIFLKLYDKSSLFRKLLRNFFQGIPGRGREKFFQADNSSDLVRQFDGIDNPIGWAGDKKDIEAIIPTSLKISKVSYEFSPTVYILPFIPTYLHRFISRFIPLMMYVKLINKG